MNKKSLLSIILALMLCFTTVIPAAAAPAFAEADTTASSEETMEIEAITAAPAKDAEVVPDAPAADTANTNKKLKLDSNAPAPSQTSSTEGEEKPLPSMAVADDVVAGEGSYIMQYNQNLSAFKTWTYTLNTERSCMLYFYIESNESSQAEFSLSVVNNDTGETAYFEEDWINTDYYWEDGIGLNAGNYTITFKNEDYVYNHYYLDVYYQPFHTVEDPYYCIQYPEDSIIYNLVFVGKTMQLTPAILPGGTVTSVTWSSSNPEIATIDQNGLVTALAKGQTIITAVINGVECTAKIFVEDPIYSSLNYKAITLYTKETVQLDIKVDPPEYGLDGLTWTSSNTKVATVNANGLVTAKAKGTATITASVNGITRTCTVTVKPMGISKTKATVYVNKTQQLKVNGGTGKATWKSSNKKVATVNANGVVKGIKPGTATITAKKDGKTFKCKVTVQWEPETGKSTTTTYTSNYSKDFDINMVGDGKLTFKITNTDSGSYADNFDVTVYNPKAKRVVDVSVAPGQTKTVSINTSLRGDFSVYCYGYGTVKLTKTTKPSLSKTTMKVGKGYTNSLKVYGVKNGGTWSSSNKKIATVTSKGVVKGKKNGTCYIKYTLKTGKVIKCKVTVVNPVTVRVTSVQDEIIYNDCWVEFNNYTNKKITYIEFNIKQYDGRGYKVSSPYDFYYNDYPMAAYSSSELEYWVNDSARKCTAYIKKVWFADGTTWRP